MRSMTDTISDRDSEIQFDDTSLATTSDTINDNASEACNDTIVNNASDDDTNAAYDGLTGNVDISCKNADTTSEEKGDEDNAETLSQQTNEGCDTMATASTASASDVLTEAEFVYYTKLAADLQMAVEPHQLPQFKVFVNMRMMNITRNMKMMNITRNMKMMNVKRNMKKK